MKKLLSSFLFAIAGLNLCHAISPADIRFANIDSDTTEINRILEKNISLRNRSDGAIIRTLAEEMTGLPYRAGTLEGEGEEILTVDMSHLDCTTLVENVIALALTIKENRTSWRDFATHLMRLRYRGGRVDGYASRLHYISDWIIDNHHKGLIDEATDKVSANPSYTIKTLDFMSRNRRLYPALADSAAYEKIRSVESGYRSHRFPYIKSRHLGAARLADGDIIFFTTKKDGLDVSHAGIIVMKNGIPYLLHASSAKKKVVVDERSLADYLKANSSNTGIRVVRLRN